MAYRPGRTSIDEHVEYAELIHHLAPLISVYGSWLVAAIIALECVGVPLPGETVLIAAALYAGSTHELSIWSVFVAGVLGGVIGNFIAFWVGREFGYRLLLRYGHYVHLSESRIKIGQYLFLRHGSKVVFFARFVPLLRSVVGFLAGANYMPWRDFWIANIAGAIAVGRYRCLRRVLPRCGDKKIGSAGRRGHRDHGRRHHRLHCRGPGPA